MMIENVYYATQPDRVLVTAKGKRAIIEFPIGVSETEEGWVAETVYSIETMNTQNLEKRVNANYELWLELAKKPEPQTTELSDVVEAINALTEIVLGGE